MSQHMNGPTKEDSLFSTVYSRSNPKYDVYYHPYAPDSLLSGTKSIVECSNGEVRYMDDIPYTKYQNFFREIKIEAENHGLLQTGEKWTNANATTWFSKSTTADSISGGGYMIFNASSSTRNTEFPIQRTPSTPIFLCSSVLVSLSVTKREPCLSRELISSATQQMVDVTSSPILIALMKCTLVLTRSRIATTTRVPLELISSFPAMSLRARRISTPRT